MFPAFVGLHLAVVFLLTFLRAWRGVVVSVPVCAFICVSMFVRLLHPDVIDWNISFVPVPETLRVPLCVLIACVSGAKSCQVWFKTFLFHEQILIE